MTLSLAADLVQSTRSVAHTSMAPQIIRDNFPTHVFQRLRLTLYLCPKVANASRSSRTAVGTSSKFSAEMAHRACFCAFIMA